MSLSKYQKQVLAHELEKPDYDGMNADGAHDFLHEAKRDRTPRISERFSGDALRKAGIPTLLGWTDCQESGEPFKVALAMPNAIDRQEFSVLFNEVRGQE